MAEEDRESVKALLEQMENSSMRRQRHTTDDMTKQATRAWLAALRQRVFPSPVQMPHDEAWDKLLFAARSSHNDWRDEPCHR